VHYLIAHGIAIPLAWILVIALATIGTFALVEPKQTAEIYGAPTGARGFAFVRAAGWRDVVVALILGVCTLRQDRVGMGVVAAGAALLALGDVAIVWSEIRRFGQPLLAHLAGVLIFLVLLESLIWQ
jgi:hypothetical protein